MYHKDQKYNLLLSKFLFLDVVVGGTLLLSIYIFLSNTVIKKNFSFYYYCYYYHPQIHFLEPKK